MGALIGTLILLSLPFMVFYSRKADKAYYKKKTEKEEQAKREYEKEYDDIIKSHATILARKMRQLIYQDDYGDYIVDKFVKELAFYKENKLLPRLSRPPTDKEMSAIDEKIRSEILVINEQFESSSVSLDGISDPYEYERAVAEILALQGWDARTTKGSGDQGVDVIAVKSSFRLVVQCKLYSSPVGNKAVQEVFAAKQFENANLAAVVTNAGYTKSARQLANSTGVALLSHEDIMNIDDLLLSDRDGDLTKA